MKKFLIFLSVIMIAAIGVYLNSDEFWSKKVNEDAYLDAIALATKHGYTIETHEVQTEDGYLLTLHRIPNGKSRKSKGRGPVLLGHGYLCSSDDFIINGPDKGLGYILVEEGYDVWMGNTRGNFYSRRHIDLDPNKRQFWYFSIHELGIYDLPVMIDYILNNTGEEKLQYIGHSLGSASFIVMCSEKPEYNAKIKSFHALAPVVHSNHAKSWAFRYLGIFASLIELTLDTIGKAEFLPRSNLTVALANKFCSKKSTYFLICRFILHCLIGDDLSQIDLEKLPIYLSHIPAGGACRQQTHFVQIYHSGIFKQFDHGYYGNQQAYNSSTPPEYKLDRVTVPVALYYGDNDVLADSEDVINLLEEFPNTIGLYRVPCDTFTHLDFLWAKDAKSLLYDRIIETIKLYD